MAVAQSFLAGFQWPAFGFPFGDAAIENGDFMGTENRQHPPGAGCALERAVVIENHAAAVAKAERLHAAGKFLGWRQHIVDRVA